MNVNEVLRASAEVKRNRFDGTLSDDDDADPEASAARRRRIDPALNEPVEEIEDERERAMRILATDDAEGEILDEQTVKRMILAFEKRISNNQKLRMKFADEPSKFMESEMELHVELQKMHVLATAPEFYHLFVRLGSAASLIGLLEHENADISIDAVDLLKELTDADESEDNSAHFTLLVNALLEHNILQSLFNNLARLQDQSREEADGIHNSLNIIENMIEIHPEVARLVVVQTELMQWLLARTKGQEPDGIKLYATEILSILLQSSEENCTSLDDMGGIDTLLYALARYRKTDPNTKEEEEIMENLFNSLCTVLMIPRTRVSFWNAEGLELMLLMLKAKRKTRRSGLRVCNYALQPPFSSDGCSRFIEIVGLKSLFPCFMKSSGKEAAEFEEHSCSVILSLLLQVKDEAQRNRVLNKFVESDFEKIDRLMELHFKYTARMEECEKQIARGRKSLIAAGDEIDDEVENEFFLKRISAGLLTLQYVDSIVALIYSAGIEQMTNHVKSLLNVRNETLEKIVEVVKAYSSSLDESWVNQKKILEETVNKLLANKK